MNIKFIFLWHSLVFDCATFNYFIIYILSTIVLLYKVLNLIDIFF